MQQPATFTVEQPVNIGVPGTNPQPQQQQVIIHVHNAPQTVDNRVFPGFQGKKAVWLGSTQLFFAVMCIICNAVGIHSYNGIKQDYEYNIFYPSAGFWSAIFFITSGSIAIVTAGEKTNKNLKSLLGTSITSMLLGLGMVGWSAFLVVDILDDYDLDSHFGQVKSAVAMAAMMLGAGVGEALTSVGLTFLSGEHICGSKGPVTNQSNTIQNLNTAEIIRAATMSAQVPQTLVAENAMTPQGQSVVISGNVVMPQSQGVQYHNAIKTDQMGQNNQGYTTDNPPAYSINM